QPGCPNGQQAMFPPTGKHLIEIRMPEEEANVFTCLVLGKKKVLVPEERTQILHQMVKMPLLRGIIEMGLSDGLFAQSTHTLRLPVKFPQVAPADLHPG